MPGHRNAQDVLTDHGASPRPGASLVVVDDPQRLNRELLVAAIDAVPGLSAIDASTASSTALDRADAAVVAARSLQFGSLGLLADRRRLPRRVVVIADNGPVSPCGDARGLVVVSRDTPLEVVVDALRSDATDIADRSAWPRGGGEGAASLTPRELQVLGLLASGLSPTDDRAVRQPVAGSHSRTPALLMTRILPVAAPLGANTLPTVTSTSVISVTTAPTAVSPAFACDWVAVASARW